MARRTRPLVSKRCVAHASRRLAVRQSFGALARRGARVVAMPAAFGMAALGVVHDADANGMTISPGTVAFGTISNILDGPVVTSEGTFRLSCKGCAAKNTFTVTLGYGTAGSEPRHMRNGSSGTLTYDFFRSVADEPSTPWGGSTALVGTVSNNSSALVTVYGYVTAGQSLAPPGAYSDTVAVTIVYN